MFFAVVLLLGIIAVLTISIGANTSAAGAGSTNATTFGLAETSEPAAYAYTPSEMVKTEEDSVLTQAADRNIDKAVDEMAAAEEAERIAAEEARLAEEAAKQAEIDALQITSQEHAALAGLEAIDWSMSQENFINTWTVRIDNYLAGSTLAGYGATFAEAAWANGVDPRLSPAISTIESSKGAICFKSHNAWGWGQSSWGSWTEAINGHIQGLVSAGYAPMITPAQAQRYCPPNPNWYSNTVSEMSRI